MKHTKCSILTATLLTAALTACPVAAKTGVVTADLLNVRERASTSSDIVGTVSEGQNVIVTYGPDEGWCEIYYQSDCYYVCADYVSIDGYVSSSSYDEEEDYSYDDEEDYTYGDNAYEDDTSYEDEEDSSSSSGTYLGNFTLTGYCNCAQCCGTAGNPTASGVMPSSGHTVAMGGLPFGTELLINGTVYTVEDRGTPYGHVDIYFDTHAEALAFGLQYADVYQLS